MSRFNRTHTNDKKQKLDLKIAFPPGRKTVDKEYNPNFYLDIGGGNYIARSNTINTFSSQNNVFNSPDISSPLDKGTIAKMPLIKEFVSPNTTPPTTRSLSTKNAMQNSPIISTGTQLPDCVSGRRSSVNSGGDKVWAEKSFFPLPSAPSELSIEKELDEISDEDTIEMVDKIIKESSTKQYQDYDDYENFGNFDDFELSSITESRTTNPESKRKANFQVQNKIVRPQFRTSPSLDNDELDDYGPTWDNELLSGRDPEISPRKKRIVYVDLKEGETACDISIEFRYRKD